MESNSSTVLVAGGGGFIGGHLAGSVIADGCAVRVVDRKPIDEWQQVHPDAENIVADLQGLAECRQAVAGVDFVYDLAADMGGMGFIESNKALCMLSVLTGTHLLLASRDAGVGRFFFSSSACVYAADKQVEPTMSALKETDAYPAMPEDGYGWEKLFTERMCRHFREDFGLETRVARYHNVYGPKGTWRGGREKAPAALARKIAEAKLTGSRELRIWGDGKQTRSFTYIDDCIYGTKLVASNDKIMPVNIGSEELVSINQLADILEDIAGVSLDRTYDTSAPQGVRGRNSDNAFIRQEYGWAPSVSLRTGLELTYEWILGEVEASTLAFR